MPTDNASKLKKIRPVYMSNKNLKVMKSLYIVDRQTVPNDPSYTTNTFSVE